MKNLLDKYAYHIFCVKQSCIVLAIGAVYFATLVGLAFSLAMLTQ